MYHLHPTATKERHWLTFVYRSWQPTTSHVSLSTLYASALTQFATTSDVHKVVDVRGEEDAETLLTKAGLDKKLGA